MNREPAFKVWPRTRKTVWRTDLAKITRATRAAYRELLDSDDSGRTGMNPDATHTILAMIATWGIPILHIDNIDPEHIWLWADLHLRGTASVPYLHRPFGTGGRTTAH